MAEPHTADAADIARSGRNLVGWFEIYVADMQRAKDFYADVVQTSFTESPMSGGDMEMWMFAGDPMAAGATGGLIRHDMRPPSMDCTLVYFSVDDCAAAIARATARGKLLLSTGFRLARWASSVLSLILRATASACTAWCRPLYQHRSL